jgi:hypothetical protein
MIEKIEEKEKDDFIPIGYRRRKIRKIKSRTPQIQ